MVNIFVRPFRPETVTLFMMDTNKWISILNSIISSSIMELNQNSIDDAQKIVNSNEKVFKTENPKYLYPNGHRTTHQMKWFKWNRDRDLKSDITV